MSNLKPQKDTWVEEGLDWLHLEYFAKLDKKRNPHGMVCILCNKTHFIKDCPHKDKVKNKNEFSGIYSQYGYGD